MNLPLPRLPRTGSLARRILIGAGLWSVLVLFAGAISLTTLYRSEAIQLLEEDLDASLIALSRAVDVDETGAIVADVSRLPADTRFDIPLSGRYWAILEINPDGEAVRDVRAPSVWDGEIPLPESIRAQSLASPGATIYANAQGPADETVRLAARTIVFPDSGTRAILMASADRGAPDAGARRFLLTIVGAMVALAGGVMAMMIVQVRVVLRPLGRIQGDLAAIRTGERAQLSDDYPDEVRPLTEELNKLIDHNRDVVERARTHVGNLAHALKTPLAVLRNEAEGETPLDDVVRRQTEAMHANVEHYLKRAQAAARAQAIGARTDVAEVADGLARMLGRLFADKGIEVTSNVTQGLAFRGEAQDLEEMVGNLMENACKWARTDVVLTGESAENGWIKLHVDDNGKGLAGAEMEDAIKRGVRLDETAPGTGLGLSIVNELAELHAGTLTLSRSPMGGLRASLKLPSI